MGGGGSKKKLESEEEQKKREQLEQEEKSKAEKLADEQLQQQQQQQQLQQQQQQQQDPQSARNQQQQKKQKNQNQDEDDDEDGFDGFFDNEQRENMKGAIKDIEADLSKEMKPYNLRQMQPDFGDLSQIYSEEEEIETSQMQAQRIFERIEMVQGMKQKNQKKLQIMKWPPSGTCKIMSSTFKVVYSVKDQDLKLVKSYDSITVSTLNWQKHSKLTAYEFSLQDNQTFNASNATSIQLPNNLLTFIVSPNGDFICIKDERDYVKKVRKNQTAIQSRLEKGLDKDFTLQKSTKRDLKSISKARKQEQGTILSSAEGAIKKTWEKQMGCFLKRPIESEQNPQGEGEGQMNSGRQKKSNGGNQEQNENNEGDWAQDDNPEEFQKLNRDQLNQKQNMQQPTKNYNESKQIEYNGYQCTLFETYKEQEKDKMESFLKDKLTQDQQYYKKCFKNPTKTIRDKLRVWDIITEDEEHSELIPTKFRFPVLRRYEHMSGVMEDNGKFTRPHSIITDSCKLIVIDHKRDLFVEVQQEIKLLIFLHSQNTESQNDNHFYAELAKFKDRCDEALKLITLDLFRVRSLPLTYKPKLKKKYFELY